MEKEVQIPKCLQCGSTDVGQRYDGGQFCKNCGAIVKPCSKCGGYDIVKSFDDEFFCRTCGAKGNDLFCDNAENKKPVEKITESKTEYENTYQAPLYKTVTANAGSKSFEAAKERTVQAGGKMLTEFKSNKKIMKVGITVICLIVAIILTAVLVKGNSKLENDWAFGANTYSFKSDGTFSSNVSGIQIDGTYVTKGDKITLSYKFMGLMDKTTDLTYSISGNELTLSGDVTLTGVGNMTLTYECSDGGGNTLKIVLIIAEIIAAAAFIYALLKKKNVGSISNENQFVTIQSNCPYCRAKLDDGEVFCGECGKKVR